MVAIETKEQLNAIYDGAMEKLSVINQDFKQSMSYMIGIFLRGVHYENETSALILSYGVDPTDPDFCDEGHAANTIFRKGKELISQIAEPETLATLMLWYARIRGISVEEIISLGSDSGSQLATATMRKLDGIKQDFTDLINSCNPEKIADFYFSVFKQFKKDSGLILKSGELDGFVRNWGKLVMWVGVTGAVQKSLEDESGFSTVDQRTVILLLNVRIKKLYGDNVSLRDMIACMQSVDFAFSMISNSTVSPASYYEYLRMDESGKNAEREKLASAVRVFNYIVSLSLNYEFRDELLKLPSVEMGKASVVLCHGNNLVPGSQLIESEMKSIAGDFAYSVLYDLSASLDFPYANEGYTSLGTDVDPEIVKNFIDQNKFDLVLNSDESISEIVAHKCRNIIPLTYQEIAVFFSDINTGLDKESMNLERRFFSMDTDVRMSDMAAEIKYGLEQYCDSQIGISAEEYLCGMKSVDAFCKSAYRAHIKLIKRKKTGDAVCVSFHKQFSKLFQMRFKTLKMAGSASQEFIEMEQAFNSIISNDPNYPSGHENEYKYNLHYIIDKAERYIDSLHVNETADIPTGIEQMRYIQAKRLEAFAVSILCQIQKAEDALNEVI